MKVHYSESRVSQSGHRVEFGMELERDGNYYSFDETVEDAKAIVRRELDKAVREADEREEVA